MDSEATVKQLRYLPVPDGERGRGQCVSGEISPASLNQMNNFSRLHRPTFYSPTLIYLSTPGLADLLGEQRVPLMVPRVKQRPVTLAGRDLRELPCGLSRVLAAVDENHALVALLQTICYLSR